MRIYNGTNSTMNLPMPNGSRLIIGSKAVSKQFFPTVELLTLLVSAYSRDDIAIIIDSGSEIQMGATVSALPGYIAKDVDEAIERLNKKPKAEIPVAEKKVEVKDQQSKASVKPQTIKSAPTVVEQVKDEKEESK